MFEVVEDPTIGFLFLFLAIALSLFTLHWLEIPIRDYHKTLCERWVFGIPWGTIVVVSLLFFVYLFVQRGYWHWNRPVMVAFTAVSMYDPTGWLFAGFSHSSPSHLRGNITSTLVFGPIVEWIWRHKPGNTHHPREPVWFRVPWIRAIVLFPAGILVIGVTAALFSWGPVIGFSVAVYALMGISLLHYPIVTLVALVARETIRIMWRTMTDPLVLAETVVRSVRPSWYGTAVQGHLVGLLLGVAIGITLVRYHRSRPSIPRLWLASILLGFYLSLWALWWILGPEEFILFRAIGVGLIFLVAAVITLSVTLPYEEVVPARLSPHTVAIACLAVAIVGMGAIGIALNFATAEAPETPVVMEVNDYEITYGENVPDGMVNVLEFEALGLTTDVRTSGVIVYSEERHVWRQTVSASELETRGGGWFTVGGLGWSEEIRVQRAGWVPTGQEPVYQIWMADQTQWNHAFASDPKTAQVRIAERTFTFSPEDGTFYLGVTYENETEWVEIPGIDETKTVQEVDITRQGRHLIASYNGTDVSIATRERYN